jgi:hypothetical protein
MTEIKVSTCDSLYAVHASGIDRLCIDMPWRTLETFDRSMLGVCVWKRCLADMGASGFDTGMLYMLRFGSWLNDVATAMV